MPALPDTRPTTGAERLASLVRGDAIDARLFASADPETWCLAAEAEGVLALVAERAPELPPPFASAVVARARDLAAADLVREVELRRVVRACAEAGVEALVIKGAHLAYGCYARPDLRPRTDTDLLVRERDRAAAGEVLQRDLGYAAVPQVTGDLLMYQAPYARRAHGGLVHLVDLHWRVANPQRFGDSLDFDLLNDDAQPLPRLDRAARVPGDVAALLLACVHRIAHHHDAPRLIWTFDVHLLAASVTPAGWARVVDLASRRSIAGVCLRGLDAASALFATPVPADVREALADAASAEPSLAAYVGKGRAHAVRVADDFRRLASWSDRWRLARQHLLPSTAYMRDVYAPASRSPLAWLYARRAWRGAVRWLRHS